MTFDTKGDGSVGMMDTTIFIDRLRKKVVSKNFNGGDITIFLGGAEIDLSNADFSGQITVDVTNTFGGIKLIVPPNWEMVNHITFIFGGLYDKRKMAGRTPDGQKRVVLEGSCTFGGIEIACA